MYLELPDVESFKEEAKRLKLKEVRAVSVWQQVPSQPVAQVALSIVLTASNGVDIIRCVSTLGKESVISQDRIDKLSKIGADTMAKLEKELKPTVVRKGMFKYPSEVNA